MKKFKVVQVIITMHDRDNNSLNRLEDFLNSGWSIVDVRSATIPSRSDEHRPLNGGAVFVYILQSKDG